MQCMLPGVIKAAAMALVQAANLASPMEASRKEAAAAYRISVVYSHLTRCIPA